MVSHLGDDAVEHLRFVDLPGVLRPGDSLVANDSATVPARSVRRGLTALRWRCTSRPRPAADLWVVEPRRVTVYVGEVLTLARGATATLLVPYADSQRLWVAVFSTDARELMRNHGRPIAYPYVRGRWPIEMYQTMYAGPAARPKRRTGRATRVQPGTCWSAWRIVASGS